MSENVQKKMGKSVKQAGPAKAPKKKAETLPGPEVKEEKLLNLLERMDRDTPLKIQLNEAGNLVVPEEGLQEWLLKISEGLATTDLDAIGMFLGQIAWSAVHKKEHPDAAALNRAFAAIYPLRAKDTLETMLLIQAVAAHDAAVHFLGRAVGRDQAPGIIDANINRATKLSRTYVALIECLTKYRRKEQRVVVEHVHVHQGGQAIVGTLTHTGKRVGRGDG